MGSVLCSCTQSAEDETLNDLERSLEAWAKAYDTALLQLNCNQNTSSSIQPVQVDSSTFFDSYRMFLETEASTDTETLHSDSSSISSISSNQTLKSPKKSGIPRASVLIYSITKQKAKVKETIRQTAEFLLDIDCYIRSRNDYDSAIPQRYGCPMSLIVESCESCRDSYPLVTITIPDLIRSSPRFCWNRSNDRVSLNFTTPFQDSDNERVYGYFKCSNCNKTWESAYSWKNKWQQCNSCETNIYPYYQCSLGKAGKKLNDLTSHDVMRCQLCLELGSVCAQNFIR